MEPNEIMNEFSEKFTPEWWNGFGTSEDINAQGIESIELFILSAIKRTHDSAYSAGYKRGLKDANGTVFTEDSFTTEQRKVKEI